MARITDLARLALLSFVAAQPVLAQSPDAAALDFGMDGTDFADDGECDDLRFTGDGMAKTLLTDHIGRDASDCRALFEESRIALDPLFAAPPSPSAIRYGDDASRYAGDGECDDIRFTGDYAAQMIYLAEDIGHDATDCREAVRNGTAHWQGAVADPVQKRIIDGIGDMIRSATEDDEPPGVT